MTDLKAPFHADIVGSFLRPEYLKQAREEFKQGKIDKAQLTAVEDKAIDELVAKEESLGLEAVTDGEFRRSYWHLDFLADLIGVEKVSAQHWSVQFKGAQPKAATLKITGALDFGAHPFLQHFKYLKSIVKHGVCKLTIPSPSMLHLICCVREEHYQPIDIYKDEQALFDAIALTYQKVIKAFYAAGCRYLQLDDTSWGEFCDQEKRRAYTARGFDIDAIARNYVAVINKALEAKPADMAITMHVCRGNFRSTWFSSGGYEPVAEILFKHCNVDGFFLEYDSDRSGGFEPLRYIQKQKVVLGLITSKTPQLEDEQDVIARIKEASKYVKLEQLCLSTQCGFASTEEGNNLTQAQQWDKIKLVQKIAADVWGK